MPNDYGDDRPFFGGRHEGENTRRICGRGTGRLALSKELLEILMGHVSDFFEIANMFANANSPWFGSAPIALKNVAEQNDISLITYGEIYASLNRNKAVRYACRTRYGSELLMFIDDAIRVLKFNGDRRADHILKRFPEVSHVLGIAHTPMIIEFSHITIDQLKKLFFGLLIT